MPYDNAKGTLSSILEAHLSVYRSPDYSYAVCVQ